jgi:Zn-dependent protease with chaperone function
MQQAARKRLAGLEPGDYEHPADRDALANLRGMPGFDGLVRSFDDGAFDRAISLLYAASNIRLSGDSFPEIVEVLEEACAILDVAEAPRLYVRDGTAIQAFTVGIERPAIVLQAACIDRLSPEDLLFVVGHELGHIKSGHALYQHVARTTPDLTHTTAAPAPGGLGLGGPIGASLALAMLRWGRASELTADRAGLMACQDLNVAQGVMAKMAGLPQKLCDRFNVDDLAAQAKELAGGASGQLESLLRAASIAGEPHPWIVFRAAALHRWVSTREYDRLLTLARPFHGGPEAAGFCSSCGRQAADGDAYCSRCGARLLAGSARLRGAGSEA